MAKKKVVVVGNCQARPIATLLEQMSDEIEITKIAIVHLLKNEQEHEFAPFFEDADYIIAQLVNDNYPCHFVRTKSLEDKYKDKIVKIVNLFCYIDTPYLKNLPKNLRIPQAPFGDYHFPIVFEHWEKGLSIDQATLALEERSEIQKDNQELYLELDKRENESNVKIMDYIKQSKKRLFHTFNHPTNDLLREYTKRILVLLGMKIKSVNYPSSFLGQFEPFINNGQPLTHQRRKNEKIEVISTKELVNEFYNFYSDNIKTEVDQSCKIPKVIVQYWNNKDKPIEINKLMQSWHIKNPDFEYQCFDRDSASSFIEKYYGNECKELFLKAKLPAMQSDIFRVAYCYKLGGIYVDAATNSINKLPSDIKDTKNLIVMRKWHGGIWNGFIASPPKNIILEKIWENIISNLKSESINDVWKATGPGLFNKHCDQENILNPPVIYPQNELRKYFELVNDLTHKKEGQHWSEKQKSESIYLSKKAKNEIVVSDELLIFLNKNRVFFSPFGNDKVTGRFKKGELLFFDKNVMIEPYSCYINGSSLFSIGSFSFSRSPLPIGTKVGRYCSIGARVSILGVNHPISRFTTSNITYDQHTITSKKYFEDYNISSNFQVNNSEHANSLNVTIGHDVWIGEDVSLSRGVTIGNGAILAAKSMVTKDVPPYAIVAGNPARIIRYRFSEEQINDLVKLEWWNYNLHEILKDKKSDLDIEDFITKTNKMKESNEIEHFRPSIIKSEDILLYS